MGIWVEVLVVLLFVVVTNEMATEVPPKVACVGYPGAMALARGYYATDIDCD